MGSYSGQVVIPIGGAEYTVRANLQGRVDSQTVEAFGHRETVRGAPVWGGTLTTVSADLVWEIHQAETLMLRTEDGRVGAFTVTDRVSAADVLHIRGIDLPPFDI